MPEAWSETEVRATEEPPLSEEEEEIHRRLLAVGCEGSLFRDAWNTLYLTTAEGLRAVRKARPKLEVAIHAYNALMLMLDVTGKTRDDST